MHWDWDWGESVLGLGVWVWDFPLLSSAAISSLYFGLLSPTLPQPTSTFLENLYFASLFFRIRLFEMPFPALRASMGLMDSVRRVAPT